MTPMQSKTNLAVQMLLVYLDPTSLALVGGWWLENVAERLGTDLAVGGSAVGDGQQLVTFVTHKRLHSRLGLDKRKRILKGLTGHYGPEQKRNTAKTAISSFTFPLAQYLRLDS